MMPSSSPFSVAEFGCPLLSSLKPLLPIRRVTKLFEGSKNLWRQRILVDIIVLQHEKLTITDSKQSEYTPICIEIIVINPSIENDASHLYLSYSKLYNKLLKYEAPIQTAGIALINTAHKCMKELIISYVMNRVDVVPTILENDGIAANSFKVILLLLGDDSG